MNPAANSQLKSLYEKIRIETRRLDQTHQERLSCGRGCSDCCVDNLTVFEIEARNIESHHARLLETSEPHPEGKCAFLGPDDACRIYEQRPYVCRTQGYPLRWVEADRSGFVELRDICPLNATEELIETLPEEDCWLLGPIEGELAALQAEFGTSQLRRIELRQLFVTARD